MLVLGIDVVIMTVIALAIILGEYLVLELFTTVPEEFVETIVATFAGGTLLFVVCYVVMAKVLDFIAGGMWLP